MTSRLVRVGRPLDAAHGEAALTGPDWAQASPARIRAALKRAVALPSGGWYVLGPSREVGRSLQKCELAGRSFVAFRDGEQLIVGPDECPHMGAPLSEGKVCQGKVVCPWHGLAIGTKHGAWQSLPVHDDGILTWVRLDPLHEPGALSASPSLAARPENALIAVVQREAACDPADVLGNRLDPWHGAHFHPQAFATLRVTDASDDVLRVRVAYRIWGPFVIEVDATFHCPGPRSIVMTIVAGEGTGSVVETHAIPIARGRTRIIEVTMASSERPGFRFARALGGLIRPFMERVAHGLWDDDVKYAERTYALRTGAIATSLPLRLPSDLPLPSEVHDESSGREPLRRLTLLDANAGAPRNGAGSL